ncbi:AraC family transcriptional regulator [Pelagicoccus sp. SDUM812003]|uniref:AraC family transcriptional regulator n=1 Tax=Pelagicoccus sp. SDUM812003 TaxID=3041267 RepID=UPI00280DBD6B|nr:AraC family transcriptional regulator [Pelagicoccus sp. SDUM812003]MDQ8201740.1 AraC family transcriptional regulator [Pelagicoccus sp. SDUM812003]
MTEVATSRIPPLAFDPIGEALHALRMSGAFYCRSDLSAPWGVELPAMPEHLMFHVLTKGNCSLEVDGEMVRLAEGDVVLVPHGTGHTLRGEPEDQAVPLFETERQLITDRYEWLSLGGGGEATRMICGAVQLGHPVAKRIVDVLPNCIRWKAAMEQGGPICSSISLLIAEMDAWGVGGETLVTRLSDILVIQILRHWLETEGASSAGWLAALKDGQVGKALQAIHRRPNAMWSLGELASEAGMSRSAFAARFQELIGEPPMRYLRDWRMQMALERLSTGKETIAQLAEDFGYESEAAFSRAFKRVIGSAPGAFRKRSVRS